MSLLNCLIVAKVYALVALLKIVVVSAHKLAKTPSQITAMLYYVCWCYEQR